VVFSIRSIREETSQGHLVTEPLADGCIQSSGVALRLSTPAEALCGSLGSLGSGSKYQGQAGPTASRTHQDFPKRTD
jgi:deoxycytidine triphosphate deaminase